MPLVGIKHGYNGLLRKSTSIKDDLQELYLDTVLDIAEPARHLSAHRALRGVQRPQVAAKSPCRR